MYRDQQPALWDPAKKRGLLEPWRDGIKGFQKWRGWSPEFPMVIPTDPNFGSTTKQENLYINNLHLAGHRSTTPLHGK
jgi:hypothetical protein